MSVYLLPGLLGLLLGLVLRWTRLCSPHVLREALALRLSHGLRTLLFAIGCAMALAALMMWLAVIDVDGVAVLPLSAGVLAGGAVFGMAAALSGYTPLTAFPGAVAGNRLEALCTLLGCLAGSLLLPLLESPLAALQALPPQSAATVFRVTLDEEFLLGGGFLGQGCAGLLLAAIAVCLPSNLVAARRAAEAEPSPEETPAPLLLLPAPQPAEDMAADASAEEAADDAVPQEAAPAEEGTPEAEADESAGDEGRDAAADAFIAVLPGESPLVVDTALDEELSAEEPSEEPSAEKKREQTTSAPEE